MLNGVLSLLEPYEVKVSSTVLRGEGGRNASDLPDIPLRSTAQLGDGSKKRSQQGYFCPTPQKGKLSLK